MRKGKQREMERRTGAGKRENMKSKAEWKEKKPAEGKVTVDRGKNPGKSSFGEKNRSRRQSGEDDRQHRRRGETAAWQKAGKESGKRTKEGEKGHRTEKGDVENGRKVCRAFGDCGGCQMLHIPYEKQLKRKEKETAKLLRPYVELNGTSGTLPK